MNLAKIMPDGSVDMRFCTPELGARMTELRNAGFLDCVPSEPPQCEPGYIAVDSYSVVDGRVIQSWEIRVDAAYYQEQIAGLKNQLIESDYMVTKCYEASLVGEPLPYDIAALHTQRQALRDEINRLECLVA